MTSLLMITLSVFFLLGCSGKPKNVSNSERGEQAPTSTSSIEAKLLASEQEASMVTEISFHKKTTVLTKEAKERLLKMLASADRSQKIERVRIITWPDSEYPAASLKKLSTEQINLVKKRNQELEKFLKAQNKQLKFDFHNMAERPGRISEIWGSSDSRIKKSLEDMDVPTTDSRKPTSSASKASKSIVMLQYQAPD